jgi:uncharacterized Zn finger protein
MSRWDGDGFDWRTAQPKKPPPEHGIKMQKSGTTWWGQRWIDALTAVLGGDTGRLSRGRSYARAGRTHDLVVQSGKVSAKVTGSSPEPYDVTIALSVHSDATWERAIAGMAAKAQFAAELLNGQMPEAINEVFHAARASLFPNKPSDLVTDCSCPDWGDPCKHVAATHYVLGEALDRDPFLLFELRGRSKEQVLAALRAARIEDRPEKRQPRAVAGAASGAAANVPTEIEIPSVSLGKLTAADYERPRANLPALSLSFQEPALHGALLQQLGSPAAWRGAAPAGELLAPLVRAAAERARRLALFEPEDETAAVDEPAATSAPPKRAKRTKARGTALKVGAKSRAKPRRSRG